MKAHKVDEKSGIAGSATLSVPLTLEGWCVLHQMYRLNWAEWKGLPPEVRQDIANEAQHVFAELEQRQEGQSALYSLLGHKGDLMVLHFRKAFDEVNQAELVIAGLDLADFLEPTSSYVSMVELGLYDSTAKLYPRLLEKGLDPDSEEWKQEVEDLLAAQRKAMAPRLYPEVPPHRYLCFYPMDRRRGETKNWYELPMDERQRQMHEHGMVGRRYAGRVRQIISGSIGFDDWEWGVDLFADDPLQFKKLIYEMRFDQVSAVYAQFGSFFLGVRIPSSEIPTLLSGRIPQARPETAGPSRHFA